MARAWVMAAAIWLAALPALAQDVWGWSVIIPSVTGTDQLGTHFHNERNARAAAPSSSVASPASLQFTPSAERRAANFRRYLAERAFLATPSLSLADDATKQALAEGLLVQAVILSGVAEQVKSDPAQMRVVGGLARQSAKRFGLDLDAVSLTDAGFVPKGVG